MNCISFKMMRKVRKGLLLIMMCALLAACGQSADLELKSVEEPQAEEVLSPEEAEPSPDAPEQETGPALIKVFVCGAVASEGVYELPEGSRVYDAVKAAGGFAPDADETYVNQADYVADAQKLFIPTVSQVKEMEEESPALPQASSGEESKTVNINTADEAALMSLPGIGQARAAGIIDYREQNGPFEQPEDLMQVSGIGQAGFDKVKEYIRVR